eukprot:g71702.t1
MTPSRSNCAVPKSAKHLRTSYMQCKKPQPGNMILSRCAIWRPDTIIFTCPDDTISCPDTINLSWDTISSSNRLHRISCPDRIMISCPDTISCPEFQLL